MMYFVHFGGINSLPYSSGKLYPVCHDRFVDNCLDCITRAELEMDGIIWHVDFI